VKRYINFQARKPLFISKFKETFTFPASKTIHWLRRESMKVHEREGNREGFLEEVTFGPRLPQGWQCQTGTQTERTGSLSIAVPAPAVSLPWGLCALVTFCFFW
jgi:hypothetical protein